MAEAAVSGAGSTLPDGVRPGVATGQRVTRLLEYAKSNQFGECTHTHTLLFAGAPCTMTGKKGSRVALSQGNVKCVHWTALWTAGYMRPTQPP